MAKALFLLLLVLVSTACEAPVESDRMFQENSDYNGGLDYHPEQWGQRYTARASELQEKQPVVILQNDGSGQGLPHVRTLILSLTPSASPGNTNNILRWVIDSGVGGATSRIIIDALGVQQISLPTGKVTVSLMAEKFDTAAAFDQPNVDYVASAYIALGNTSTSQAKYTTLNEVPITTVQGFDVPAGATAWRLAGTNPTADPNGTPFAADKVYFFRVAGVTTASYLGNQLIPLNYSDGFIPLVGGTKVLVIANNNAAAALKAVVQWQLDL